MRRLFAILVLGGRAPGVASAPDDPTGEPVPTSPGTSDPTVPVTADTDDTDVPTPPDTGDAACPPVDDATRSAVISDIDETLTTSDAEWLTQIVNPSHDPAMRPDADTLMRGYIDRGYRIFYITSRGELLRLLDGTTARDATETWLDDHGFPYRSDNVYMAPGLAALNGAAADYKTGVIEDLLADGFDVAYAYGNADTDIEAYKAAGIPDDDIFLVGQLAGQFGVVPIETPDAYTNHLSFLDTVPCGH
jgi:phosphatidate phosphatase PAH1